MVKFLESEYANSHPDLLEVKLREPEFDLYNHYITSGQEEGRHHRDDVNAVIDVGYVTNSGYVFLNGWLLDPFRRSEWLHNPDFVFNLTIGYYTVKVPASQVIRYRRPDINQVFNANGDFDFGFVLCVKIDPKVPITNKLTLSLETKLGSVAYRVDVQVQICSNTVFISKYFGVFRHLMEMDNGLGGCLSMYDAHNEVIIGCWQEHLQYAREHQVIELGDEKKQFNCAFISVLYGAADLLQLQYLLFFNKTAKIGSQIIIVSNSPEIHKKVVDISYYAQKLHGFDITIVLMGANAGFSEANNIGYKYARSDKIILLNPDIFASDVTDWKLFEKMINNLPRDEIVAPLLHYSDGSVMHSGMAIYKDPIFMFSNNMQKYANKDLQYKALLRVDHPRKGHLLASFNFSQTKVKVDAVTGGFMIFHRNVMEKVGGLSTTYVYGHFEDADFCLRAAKQNIKTVCDSSLSFVHLEGKGSKGGDALSSSGSTMFNRCHFTRQHEKLYGVV